MHKIVKIAYKYQNEFINEEKLLEELEALIKEETDDKLKESWIKLKKEIEEASKENENNTYIRYKKIYDLIIKNEEFSKIADNLTDEDVMLMITDYLYAPNPPYLNQVEFDEVIDAAIKSGKDSKENCWRLAMNYQHQGLDLTKILDYLLSTRDTWYVVELLHSLDDVLDLDEATSKIIATHDKEFMNKLLKDNFLDRTLSKNQIERIQESVE